jgi:hypothetical protein
MAMCAESCRRRDWQIVGRSNVGGGDLVGDKGTGAAVLAALLEEGGLVADCRIGRNSPARAFTAGSVDALMVKGT